MKQLGRYVVYASLWHIPPPTAKVKNDLLAVFDLKGRLVFEESGGSLYWYSGRYSNKVGREAVAGYLNGVWEENVFTGDEVILTSTKEVKRRSEVSPCGGFHAFIAGEHVPEEKLFYLKAVYRRYLPDAPEVARPEKDLGHIEMVPTRGTENETDLKRAIVDYLSRKYQWYLDPDAIHLISDSELEEFRRDAQAYGYD